MNVKWFVEASPRENLMQCEYKKGYLEQTVKHFIPTTNTIRMKLYVMLCRKLLQWDIVVKVLVEIKNISLCYCMIDS